LEAIHRGQLERQRESDNTFEYCRSLLNQAKDLRAKQTDKQFTDAMDYYINYLNKIYVNHQEFSDTRTRLSEVEDGILEEIRNYNARIAKQNDPNVHWQSGADFYKQKDYRNAIKEFSLCQQLSPDFVPAYQYIGISYYFLGDMNASISYLDKAITLEPNAKLYEARGWAKYNLKDFNGALADFNKQIDLDLTILDHTLPTNSIAYYNRGSAKSGLNDNYGAINDYKKAIDINPSFSMAYNNLGWSKFKQRNYAEAIKYLDIAIEKDPSNSIAWDSRAETKLNMGDIKGCIEDCNQALILNDKLANSYLIRGRAKYKLGKKEEACEDWSDAGQYGKKEAYDFITKYCN
jgi:tetratricopeptide (TPR) repeat protein